MCSGAAGHMHEVLIAVHSTCYCVQDGVSQTQCCHGGRHFIIITYGIQVCTHNNLRSIYSIFILCALLYTLRKKGLKKERRTVFDSR